MEYCKRKSFSTILEEVNDPKLKAASKNNFRP
jgi:hypothetical protein